MPVVRKDPQMGHIGGTMIVSSPVLEIFGRAAITAQCGAGKGCRQGLTKAGMSLGNSLERYLSVVTKTRMFRLGKWELADRGDSFERECLRLEMKAADVADESHLSLQMLPSLVVSFEVTILEKQALCVTPVKPLDGLCVPRASEKTPGRSPPTAHPSTRGFASHRTHLWLAVLNKPTARGTFQAPLSAQAQVKVGLREMLARYRGAVRKAERERDERQGRTVSGGHQEMRAEGLSASVSILHPTSTSPPSAPFSRAERNSNQNSAATSRIFVIVTSTDTTPLGGPTLAKLTNRW
ncbi:hypothetical protein C8R44DRAFT_734770 [Mycena epipterygia]|nr:hypothetical protein C8R44DRAFT_734770 [Mycena epipterygia]